jgi:alpha-tubulin suppressor-like RCC1 family protein
MSKLLAFNFGLLAVMGFYLLGVNQVKAETTLTNAPVAKAIAAGGEHICAIYNTAGKVYCWGKNEHGQLGTNNNTNLTQPETAVGGILTNLVAKKVATGFAHTCVIAGAKENSSNDRAYCWGANDWGQLGDGGANDSNIPVSVGGALGSLEVMDIYAGFTTTCAKVTSGTVYCWGANDQGQFANNTTTSSNTPIASGWDNATDLAIGVAHACGVIEGVVSCAGAGADGQLGNSANNDSLTPVAVTGISGTPLNVSVGYFYSCAITQTGKFYCWGDDTSGQLGGTGKVNTARELKDYDEAAAIASGYAHSCVGLECIGENGSGQLGDDTTVNKSVMTAVVTSGGLAGLSIKDVSAGFDFTCWLAGDESNKLYDAVFCGGKIPAAVDVSKVEPQDTYLSLAINNASYNLSVVPGSVGASESKIFTVVTNNSSGYNLLIKASEVKIISTSDNTKYFTPQTTSGGSLEVNAWGYGVGTSAPSGWQGITTSDVVIDNSTAPTSGSGRDTQLWLAVKSDYSLTTGEYKGEITLTAVTKL